MFFRYRSWLLGEHKGTNIQTSTTKVINAQLDGGSYSHILTDITMFSNTRPVKYTVQILNMNKSPVKVFGLVIIEIQKINMIIPLWPSYYMP